MNTLVTIARPTAAPRGARKRLLKILLLGFVAKGLVLVAGLGGLEFLRGVFSPPVAAAKAPAGGATHPLPHTAD